MNKPKDEQTGCRTKDAHGVGGVHHACAEQIGNITVDKGFKQHEGKEPEAKLNGKKEVASLSAQCVTASSQIAPPPATKPTCQKNYTRKAQFRIA
jgi:hypothetical protein